jgi:hypothetical protein
MQADLTVEPFGVLTAFTALTDAGRLWLKHNLPASRSILAARTVPAHTAHVVVRAAKEDGLTVEATQ